MTDPIATSIEDVLREGRAAALAGDTFVARSRFRRATELDSTSADAWLGLSGVTPILAEKRQYIQRVLAFEPDNAEAHASLQYVEQLLADGYQIAPSQRRVERNISGDASPLLSAPELVAPQEVTYCYNHPDRETGLRCTACNRPICASCALISSVGQLCPECRKARRPPNYQVGTRHLVVGALVGVLVGAVGAALALFVIARIPFMGPFLMLAAGMASGELAVRAVEKLTRGKRGRSMQIAVGVGLGVGVAPFMLMTLLNPSLFTLIVLLFAVLTVTTASRRLK